MAKNESGQSWIFDEKDSDGSKAQKKIFGESKVKEYDELLKELNKSTVDDDVLQKLKDAKLEDVAAMTNAYKENLGTVISDILQNTSLIGKEFDALKKFNSTEQALKDEADSIVEIANARLDDAKNWASWKNIFGWKSRAIKARTALVTEAIAKAQELDEKAAMLFDKRIREADIDELLDQFRHMTTIGVDKLKKIADVNMDQFEQIKVRHKNAIEIVQRASKDLETLNQKINVVDAQLKEETTKLNDLVNGSPEYAMQRGVVDTKQQEYDQLKSERDRIQAGYNSKEKFAAILQTNMTALKISAGNLRSLAVKLRSDNEEREYTYANTVQLIKSSNIQQTGSLIDQVGVETDQQNLEQAITIATASEKDALKRLYEHPENMKRALKIIGAFGHIMDENKQKLLEYQEMIKNGYLEMVSSTGQEETKPVETTADIFQV